MYSPPVSHLITIVPIAGLSAATLKSGHVRPSRWPSAGGQWKTSRPSQTARTRGISHTKAKHSAPEASPLSAHAALVPKLSIPVNLCSTCTCVVQTPAQPAHTGFSRDCARSVPPLTCISIAHHQATRLYSLKPPDKHPSNTQERLKMEQAHSLSSNPTHANWPPERASPPFHVHFVRTRAPGI